jgi:hypothetical protein
MFCKSPILVDITAKMELDKSGILRYTALHPERLQFVTSDDKAVTFWADDGDAASAAEGIKEI